MLSQPSIVPRRQRIKDLILAIVLIAAGVVFFRIAGTLSSNQPVVYEDIAEHFKYGSIGSEPGGSLLQPIGGALPPYMVFKTLPSMCSEQLPGGYASTGFIFEPGHDLPIGVSRRRRFGVEQVGFNCALCHTSTVRDSPSAPRRIVLGMPAQQLDLQAVVEFILDCSLDSRMTAENIRGRFEASGQRVPLFERILLRVGLVDRLKLQTLELRNRMAAVARRRPARLGPRARRHVQSVQGDSVQLAAAQAAAVGADRRVGLSVAVEPAAARGPAAALGRRQRLGRRAQPQRGARRRRHAGHRRSRLDQTRSRLDLDAAAAGISVPGRPRPGRARRGRLPAAVRELPRGRGFQEGHARRGPRRLRRADRRDRHGSAPAGFVHRGVCRQPVLALPGVALPVHALPQDQRLREPSAGRHLAARPVPAQRLGADAARPARAARAAPEVVLSRLRRVRSAQRRLHLRPCRREGGHQFTRSTRRCPATATADISMARRSPMPTSRPSSSISRCFSGRDRWRERQTSSDAF